MVLLERQTALSLFLKNEEVLSEDASGEPQWGIPAEMPGTAIQGYF